jgi:hypothetical protein
MQCDVIRRCDVTMAWESGHVLWDYFWRLIDRLQLLDAIRQQTYAADSQTWHRSLSYHSTAACPAGPSYGPASVASKTDAGHWTQESASPRGTLCGAAAAGTAGSWTVLPCLGMALVLLLVVTWLLLAGSMGATVRRLESYRRPAKKLLSVLECFAAS